MSDLEGAIQESAGKAVHFEAKLREINQQMDAEMRQVPGTHTRAHTNTHPHTFANIYHWHFVALVQILVQVYPPAFV